MGKEKGLDKYTIPLRKRKTTEKHRAGQQHLLSTLGCAMVVKLMAGAQRARNRRVGYPCQRGNVFNTNHNFSCTGVKITESTINKVKLG